MIPRCASRAAALLIGDELLGGKVKEANLHELAKTLRAMGIELNRVVMIGDDTNLIASEISTLSQQFDLLVTSGGVGPTHDDVTLEALGLAFGVELVEDPLTRRLLERAYSGALTPAQLRMARVPKGAELPTIEGSEWPTVVFGNVWLFPGVPEIFRMKLDVLRAWVKGPRPFYSRAVHTQMDEPELAELLRELVDSHPDVCIGSYPKWFEPSYKTKITFDGRDAAAVERAANDLMKALGPENIVQIG